MARSRRELLASLAAGGALVAGCVDDGSSDEPENGDDTDEPDDQPDTAGVDDLPREGYPGTCPEYETDRVICYEAVVGSDDGDAVGVENVPAILEPASRSLAPDETIEFVLSNQSDVALSTNFYNWRLDKQVNGKWYHVAPFEINEPLMSVPAGKSHTWSVQIDNSAIEGGEMVPRASGTDDLTLAGVGGGRYAFRARGWFEDHEDDFAFAAMYDYDADPLELTTTTLVGETNFEGETLVAESAGDGQANQAYVLERVEESGGNRVITEQLVRNPHRRDAVALAQQYDADRVRLDGYTADSYVRDPLGAFQYQGQQYELTKQGED
ncbi:immunoglobulin-like domain-containing protein [Halovenus sp. HT40]|uniref:immunoglobulin-like domain-containing protein n=1 Tax=Halovenus sp. HT40 TaxID=3126691 RepID=UPI00300F22C1